MARQEQEREDLLHEAVALVERAELRISEWPEAVLIGFRRDGAASIYFGAGPAYHFTSEGALRRAYADGLLYKAERGRLASLRRQRLTAEVQLLRHDLTERETAGFLRDLSLRTGELRDRLRAGQFELVGQAPTGGDVVGRIARWLDALKLPPPVAQSPQSR
jgi:hypothetical protein